MPKRFVFEAVIRDGYVRSIRETGWSWQEVLHWVKNESFTLVNSSTLYAWQPYESTGKLVYIESTTILSVVTRLNGIKF
jgi:hypothetical protein